MNLKSLGFVNLRIQNTILILIVSFESSLCIPPYGKNPQGHGHHHNRQQYQQPIACATDPQIPYQEQSPPSKTFDKVQGQNPYQESERPPGSLVILDNQDRNTNIRNPDNGQIFPGNTNLPGQDSNYNPQNAGGIQIIIPPGNDEVKPLPQQNDNTCPEGSGIYKKTGLCYKFVSKSLAIGELSPCGPFMDFYQSVSDKRYGECDCKDSHLGFNRPIVYWEKTDQCYWLFDQGPCELSEWLILNENEVPTCNVRSCPENSEEDWSPNQADNKKKYWFRHRGKCYKSDEKGFCDNSEHNIYLVNIKNQGYTTVCKPDNIEPKTLLNGAKPLPCLPGHKQSVTGECRKTVNFE